MIKVLRGGRFVFHAAVVIGLVSAVLVRPAQAQTAESHQAIALVNATRASAGAPPLVHDAALSAVAQNWAATIAPSGALRHNPNLGTQAGGWTAMAENVGMGP
ncbi:MAG TPA: CAP domain-containing protein, partial [Acidimicrobiales bacterium]|nr:CAP domain-containing protein [Acidimicrobiales bacterium]